MGRDRNRHSDSGTNTGTDNGIDNGNVTETRTLTDFSAMADMYRSQADAASASTVQRINAKFDDLPDASAIPDGYPNAGLGSLQWLNLYTLDAKTYKASNPNSGYVHGLVSGPNVIFNSGGTPAEITSGGGNFNFDSVYLTSAHRIGMSIEIMGYDDGVLKYDKTVVVDDTAPTKFNLGFDGIDTIELISSGGTVDTNQLGTGAQFAADNFVFHGGTGAIRGQLYDDVNADGARQQGELPLAGRTVFIDTNHNGVLDAGEQSTTTDSHGLYTFTNLPFGAYDVVQVIPDGWRASAPSVTRPDYAVTSSAYSWIEVANRGTALTFTDADDGSSVVNFTHAITFFGATYTSMNVGTNGLITFGTGDPAMDYTNAAIPNAATPNAVVAPFWDDLVMVKGSKVLFYEDDLGRTVVEYRNMGVAYDTTGLQRETFEVVFRSNGQILFEYNSMDNQGRSATAGVEDANGAAGTQAFYDADVAASHTGYTFNTGSETVVAESQHVNVDSGRITGGVNFGSHDVSAQTGTIEGTAFHDLNGDGVYGPSDAPEAGWRVFIDTNGNGIRDFGEQATTTDANGHYSFATLDPGSYSVVADAPYSFEDWQFEGAAAAAKQLSHVQAPLGLAGMKALVAESQAQMAESGHIYAKADFTAAHADGQLIVRLAPGQGLNADGTPTASTQALMNSVGATLTDSTKALGIQLWTIHGMSIEDATSHLMASGKVLYANPNYTAHIDSVGSATIVDASHVNDGSVHTDYAQPDNTPNDPGYPLQYGYQQINAPEVWDYTTGSKSVVVADIDTGIDMTHPDLVNNIYTNTAEIPGNGIDDDHNGYIDDVHGWDFVNNDNDPSDDNGHGTHTAGTIGADGNNGVGVTGVNWNVSILPLKFLDASGSGSDFDAIKAIEYATMMGVKVSNNSWGGSGFDNGLYDAIAAAGTAGDLFVAAAGNSGEDNDTTNEGPAGYGLDNIISVAAVDDMQKLASFSEYGKQSVDLAAPGVDVLSTYVNPDGSSTYAYLSGTSMATPHVAGAIALIMSLAPELTGVQLKDLIMSSVQQDGYLYGKTVSGGELDLAGAINALTQTSHAVTVTAGSTTISDFGATAATTNGDDTVQGSNASERIDGYQGNDTLFGGGGNDLMIGASGNDHLTGGAGADRFFFNDTSGYDGITDFTHSDGDLILINSSSVSSFADLKIVSDRDGGSYVSWATSRVDVRNVAPGALTGNDFRFGNANQTSDDQFLAAWDPHGATHGLGTGLSGAYLANPIHHDVLWAGHLQLV